MNSKQWIKQWESLHSPRQEVMAIHRTEKEGSCGELLVKMSSTIRDTCMGVHVLIHD